MKQRQLGQSGLRVSALGLGCMGMSEFYTSGVSEAEAMAVIQHALDRGITLLDTADMYGAGLNEMLVGRALQGRREQAVVATKFGNMRGLDGSFLGINGKPEYVQAACEMSLRRLGVEHIDLYYQHRVDPQVPIEETVGAMARLVEQGKVRYLGLSEASPQTLRRAHKVHAIAALQTEYSLWSRDAEQGPWAACRELGVGFVAYSPLGRGFLTGRIRSAADLADNDWRRRLPRFQADAIGQNLQLADRIAVLAKAKGCTPGQLALAWVLAQGEDIVPIPGTKRMQYLDENIAAAEIVLTAAEREALSAAARPEAVVGTRYPEAGMRAVNR